MRLRLVRGRGWWPWRRHRSASAEPDAASRPKSSPQAARHGGPGSHRRTGAAPQPPAGLSSWPGKSGRRSRGAAGGPDPLPPPRRPERPDLAGLGPNPLDPDRVGPTRADLDYGYRPRPFADPAGRAAARAAIRTAPTATAEPGTARTHAAHARSAAAARHIPAASEARPWYETSQPSRTAPGFRDCGCIEDVLVREWAETDEATPESVTAINRLADLPVLIKEKLAAGLEAIHVGAGGVPDLDQMARFSGVPLPSGRATWDACAGAYGDRKIIVGSRPSPTPDVMCHEVGHALDDLDGMDGLWQSDSQDFRRLYDRCLPHLASDFHRHEGPLGRREFFADAFAAIASAQRPALVEMLSGDTRAALDVMLYFNVRYGI
jgi:hypothetical protein